MSPMAAATRETSVGDLEGEREAVAVWQMAPGVAHPLAGAGARTATTLSSPGSSFSDTNSSGGRVCSGP